MKKLPQKTDESCKFVSANEAVKMTGCSRSTLIKYSQLGQFPPMIKLLGERFAFVREDVQKWVDERLSSVK